MSTDTTKQTANILYPLKPNYKGKTKGWFGLLHHDTILEYSNNVIERTDYVFENKPKNELKTRSEHMVVIPDKFIPKYIKEARRKREEAARKWIEAYFKREEADRKWREAERKRREADRKWKEAYHRASKNPRIIKYLKQHTPYSWDEANQTLIY